MPCSGDIAEIALRVAVLAQSSSPSQSFQGYFIETLALFLRTPAQGSIQTAGHIPDGVLHALIVGNAGIICKQSTILRDLKR